LLAQTLGKFKKELKFFKIIFGIIINVTSQSLLVSGFSEISFSFSFFKLNIIGKLRPHINICEHPLMTSQRIKSAYSPQLTKRFVKIHSKK